MECVLACARTVCSCSDSVTVTDPDDVDDRISFRIGFRNVVPRRSARWSAVRRLAADAAKIVHHGRAPADPKLRQTYLAAAALALTLFRTRTPGQWLLSAAQCVADRATSRSQERINDPVRYLAGVLRAQCGLLAIQITDDQPALRNWFAAVMRPFEIAVELQGIVVMPEAAKPPAPAPVEPALPPATREETRDMLRAAAAAGDGVSGDLLRRYERNDAIAARRAAEPAAPSPAPGQGSEPGFENALEITGRLEQGGAERQDETGTGGQGPGAREPAADDESSDSDEATRPLAVSQSATPLEGGAAHGVCGTRERPP